MRKRARRDGVVFALTAMTLLGMASCRSDRAASSVEVADASVTAASAATITASAEARDRLEKLRARFVLPVPVQLDVAGSPHATTVPIVPRPAIAADVARSFEREGAHARAVFPAEATRGIAAAHRASVSLPMRASDPVRLENETSGVAVSFALRRASGAPIATTGGIALYAGALGGADVLHRVHGEGTEDFVVFETKPEKEEIAYDVDVSRVPGLRLVGNTLEFLDADGTPRLRIAPPYVVDAHGVRREARLAVDGCAYDTSGVGPWGRAITKPGASRCDVRVAWAAAGVAYPAMVDPSWTSTGSMASFRWFSPATLLPSGRVLVAGGGAFTAAELFDPSGAGTFGATGSLGTRRYHHTATLLPSGKVLIAGGVDGSSGPLSSAELYDPTGAGSFSPTGSMGSVREDHTATLLPSGKVLIVGGANGCCSPFKTAELFDPAGAAGTGSFTPTGSMGTARTVHTATLLMSGKVLIAGGGSNPMAGLSSAELFDPSGAGGAGSFSATGSMASARGSHTATLLGSGLVLVAGGWGASGVISSAELFDPIGGGGAGSFVTSGSMAKRRASHSATRLASGKVLVAGGIIGGSPAFPDSELFDPSGAAGTGSFATTTAMTTPRIDQSVALLNSGKVLVAGGDDGGTNQWSSAEIFALELATGGSCSLGGECLSGFCYDGVCCSAACGGTCMSCMAGTGACVAINDADDPDTCTGTHTCSASGACKLAIGQACPGGNGDCANAQCSDGYCCTTACGGACDVCAVSLGASANGTCTPAQEAYPGNPACGNGLACDGMATTCPAVCIGDLDCLAGDYCNAAGACVARKPQAASCTQAAGADCKVAGCRDCASGNCVDGFCCDTACNSLCQACAAGLKTSGALTGTCGAATKYSNPHNDTCATDPGVPCGPDGTCDGAGACNTLAKPGHSCGSSTCNANNTGAIGLLCDGIGNCGQSTVSCNEFACKGGACPSTCVVGADCISTAYCVQGTCLAKHTNGAACTMATECTSNNCVDGVCCNTTCSGQCEACDVAGEAGTCSAFKGLPHGGRTACTGAGTFCGGSCDGTNRANCTNTAPTTVCGSSCADGKETDSTCDDHGTCVIGAAKSCPNGLACASTLKCNKSCATNQDCLAGFACDATGHCNPTGGSTCTNDHTVADSSGTQSACDPYKCVGGACLQLCTSVNDCIAPAICDATGKCIAPESAPTDNSGGCAVARLRAEDTSSAWSAIALGALAISAARRRRSRRQR